MAMKDPFVSVVTPVYNGEKFLEKCIKGVLNQTYKNFEYVIVDNASTDRTPQIIEKFRAKDPRIKVLRNPETLKIIDNFNECARRASPEAKWIKYALADDYLFPNCLKEMVRVGEMDPEIGFVSAYHLDGRVVKNVGLPIEENVAAGNEMLKMHLLRKMHVCLDSPNTLLYKKSVFDELGGYDNQFLHADTELALRILDKYKLGFAHYVLTWTGHHAGRGAVYGQYYVLFTREYMRFGLKDIEKFKSVKLTDEDLDHVARWYAHEVLCYIARQILYFPWRNIRQLWSEAPAGVRKKCWKVMVQRWPCYLRIFLGSIYHFRINFKNRPTFSG
jgi:glycosyltransferase involved in cell wall biosynthesis